MKKTISILVILLALLALSGCVSTPAPTTTAAPTPPPAATAPFEILQHKGTTLGVPMPPAWVEKSLYGNSELEKLYEGKYCVIIDETGTNLDGVVSWGNNYSANNEIIKRISLRVEAKFAGSLAGDKDKVGIYQESISKSVASGTVNGFKKEADWWVQIRWYKPDGKKTWDHDEYRYLALYTIPKDLMDEQIRKAIDGAIKAKPATAEQATAMDKVKNAFYEGF